MKAGGPAFSPDGKQLAWWISGSVDASGNSTTAVAVVDLENRTTSLVHPYQSIGVGGWPLPPVWSPDSQWLAFIVLAEGSKADLWVAHPDGSEEHNLGDAAYPVWSPDSSQLVYTLWDPQGGDFTQATTMHVEAGSWLPEPIELAPGAQPLEWRTP
jgi:Tol biopolymer transport system component